MHTNDIITPRQLWSLREDALVEMEPGSDRVVVFSSWGETELERVGAAARSLLQRMTLGPVSLDNVLASDAERAEAYRLIAQLGPCVVGSLSLDDTGLVLLSVVPVGREAKFAPVSLDPQAPIRLSRFACVRSAADGLRIESALSQYQVVLQLPFAAALISSLAIPTTVAQLARMHGVTEPVAAAVGAYLVATRMVLVAEEVTETGPRFAEDADRTLAAWPFHELLFHWRTNMGRQETPPGAGSSLPLPVPPVVKPVPAGPRFPLHRPNLEQVAAADPSVTAVLEVDRLSADPYPAELTVELVGELLYRTARVRSIRPADIDDGGYEVSDRPYPSDSDLYELELYVSTDQCRGLPRGIFHYDPLGHGLTLVNSSPRQLDELLDEARVATAARGRPALLLTVTSRIGRLSRHHRGVAYATTLRNLGVLQGTLCVVAAAMGLCATCTALGDGDVTRRALRLDWPGEIQVGELTIGAPARDR